MKKKMVFFHLAYYIIYLLIYMGFFFGISRLLKTSNLGAVVLFTYGLLFVATPIMIAILTRFSLLKWYVDPLAAAEAPLFLYMVMIFNHMKRSEDFCSAVEEINETLSADGGTGWLFLIGLFLFGLAASFSFARKQEESISYRLIAKLQSKSDANMS